MKGWAIPFGIAMLVLSADFWSKYYVRKNFSPGFSVPIVERVFHITPVYNTGFVFGLFKNAPPLLSIILTIGVLAIMFIYFTRLLRHRYGGLAFGFLLGGILGNFIDRIRVGYIIDFIDIRVWPVFNLSDVSICLGMGFFLLNIIKYNSGVY